MYYTTIRNSNNFFRNNRQQATQQTNNQPGPPHIIIIIPNIQRPHNFPECSKKHWIIQMGLHQRPHGHCYHFLVRSSLLVAQQQNLASSTFSQLWLNESLDLWLQIPFHENMNSQLNNWNWSTQHGWCIPVHGATGLQLPVQVHPLPSRILPTARMHLQFPNLIPILSSNCYQHRNTFRRQA